MLTMGFLSWNAPEEYHRDHQHLTDQWPYWMGVCCIDYDQWCYTLYWHLVINLLASNYIVLFERDKTLYGSSQFTSIHVCTFGYAVDMGHTLRTICLRILPGSLYKENNFRPELRSFWSHKNVFIITLAKVIEHFLEY